MGLISVCHRYKTLCSLEIVKLELAEEIMCEST